MRFGADLNAFTSFDETIYNLKVPTDDPKAVATAFQILEDWDDRERGGAPCPVRSGEDRSGRILRQVVCRAVERELFQVVITPHHDLDHQNHVHLEVVPGIDWSFIH